MLRKRRSLHLGELDVALKVTGPPVLHRSDLTRTLDQRRKAIRLFQFHSLDAMVDFFDSFVPANERPEPFNYDWYQARQANKYPVSWSPLPPRHWVNL